ncbi:MAG: adenylosuccinate synthetase [Parcubacteria group bacterium]
MEKDESFLKTGLKRLLSGVQVVVVRCLQWGDTGKGKIVDVLMFWADIIVRGTGGDNAGHTIVNKGKKTILHLIPSGIMGDKYGKITVIGPGTVVYPKALTDEMLNLKRQGLSYDNLKISKDAKLILPTHIFEDRIKELSNGKGKIGTTGKGIGPAYADHYARIGLTMNDILNENVFRKKLERHLLHKTHLMDYPLDKSEEVMNCDHLMSGAFYNAHELFDFEQIVYQYVNLFGKALKPYIEDTNFLIKDALKRKRNILIEGAQGDLLSVDYGTYPFVTSSDSSLEGLVKGCGLRTEHVDLDLGIIKGFMETRVGSGTFPTEMGGGLSAEHCATYTKEQEELMYPDVSVNSEDDLKAGIALRKVAQEYGATTGRPRRIGYLDLPLLRHSMSRASPKTRLVLTKLDVLGDVKTIKVCTHYKYHGDRYFDGKREYSEGSFVMTPPMDHYFLSYCEPVYEEFPAWSEDITKIRDYKDLPQELKDILNFIVENVGAKNQPAIVSVGPDREETIVL